MPKPDRRGQWNRPVASRAQTADLSAGKLAEVWLWKPGWPVGVPLLSRARELGTVRALPGDGARRMNAFKLRDTILERVQVDHAG